MAKQKFNIERGTIDGFRQEALRQLERGLNRTCKKFGLTLEPGAFIQYMTGESMKFTIEFRQVSKSDKYAEQWNHYAENYGLKKEWLGRKLDGGRKWGICKIVGLDISGRKTKVVAETSDGTRIFFSNRSGLSNIGNSLLAA